MVHKLVFGLIAFTLSTASGTGANQGQSQDISRAQNGSPPRGSLHPRQTPIVVAPPSGFRTASAPQSTSLNYWWPYGPNGVNPTTTAIPVSSGTTEIEETDTVDDTSAGIESSASPAITSSTTFRTADSTLATMASTKVEETTTDNPSQETESVEPTTPGNDSFSVVALLPLFIILGVLVAVTLLGWAYGRFVRQCRHNGEPTPGGPDIGGKPYQGGGYDHDTIGPLHSLGVSWVDASRIHSQHNLGPGAYYAIRGESINEEPGTPSKNKSSRSRPGNWFRHTLSRRNHGLNSPSGEKGLNAPLVYPNHDRRLPISTPNTHNFDSSLYLSSASHTQSPKTLRTVNVSPTVGSDLLSPVTSAQPTPFLSASRHASLRRKIANKVKEDSSNDFTTTPLLGGALGGFDHSGQPVSPVSAEGWAVFKGDPRKQSPSRRYTSPNDAKSPVWSPDPDMHRERIRRLHVAAEAARCASPFSDLESPSRTGNVAHPLPQAPAVLLSPPLQPHLFFTRAPSNDSVCDDPLEGAISKFHFTRSGPSRNLSRHSDKAGLGKADPFRARAPLNPTSRRLRKGKSRTQRHLESTETLPLSPELRGAAMTKLDEIVKSHWSSRNLAELPQSPTLYGALSSPSVYHTKSEDEPLHTGIEETLLTSPGTTHT